MKKLLLFMIGTLLAFGAGAGITLRQIELQPCQGFESTKWNYCIGIFTFSGGSKYVGEWKGGKRSGKGTFIYVDGGIYVGEYKDGKQHGHF